MTKRSNHALIIGSGSAVGAALAEALSVSHQVHKVSRAETDYSEASLAQCAENLAEKGSFQVIFCCIGVLHNDTVYPERSLKQISAPGLETYYRINAILPMLCMKHFSPLLASDRKSVYVNLSAMVGSIGDNRLGGWYGYRSSKAALNMLVKTTSIEVARKNKQAIMIAVHPGTTRSPMSEPFARNVKPEKYYSPQQSAQRLLEVVDQLENKDNGGFFNWDGNTLPW